MSHAAPIGGKILTKPFVFLGLLVAIALGLIVYRLIFGLQAATNLSNGYPWGLWVIMDIHVAVAMGCGGYVLAVVVYVLNRGEFHPMVRPAVLASAFAYTLGNLAAFVDIGRWWNFYQIALPWNFNLNSIMFEIAFCMALYAVVLWIEFMPAVFEKFGLQRYKKLYNKVFFAVIALGIVLPTMHQSSLGSVIIAAGEKISPLWQTNWIPFLFLTSAFAMGFAIIIFEGSLTALGFDRPLEKPLFKRLTLILRWVLITFLAVRFADLIYRGQLGLAFAGDVQGNMFLIETLLFVTPLAILSHRVWRSSARAMFIAAVALVLAGAVLRFNALLIGFNAAPGYQYFPSLIELLVSIGMIAVHVVGFVYIVKIFPVLPRVHEQTANETSRRSMTGAAAGSESTA
jgi:Ni/Fe-hydrogenase subunit HybB-like protein